MLANVVKYRLVQRDNKLETDIPFLIRAIRKLIWLLRKAKHYMAMSIKWVAKLIYVKSHLKYLHQFLKLRKLLKDVYSYGTTDDSGTKISIALILRDGTTYPKSSAFIRLISPLSKLVSNEPVAFKIFRQNTTKLPENINVCIVQRTAYDNVKNAQKLVSTLKKRNIKLVVDNDDAFSLIDNSHSEYSIQGDRHLALEYLLKNANQVWVSTPALVEQHKADNPTVYVVANTLDKHLWKQPQQAPVTQGPLRMIYMGTATHDEDFRMLLGALDKLAKQFPRKFELSVIGVSCNDLPERRWITRLYQPPGGSIYPKFVSWFLQQGPFDIGLCPLVESPFNSYKSDIKCLDYIGANIRPVASNVPAYDTKELDDYIIRINNSQDLWVEKLSKILNDIDGFRRKDSDALPKAVGYLWNKRSSEIAAATILELLQQITN